MNKSFFLKVLSLKTAHVSPIYKTGPKDLAENYRPVSLTSISCRLMEKIINDQILEHLEREKLLSTKQHGFTRRRSTVTQSLSYLDTCAQSIARGSVVNVIYFDFAKAVPHRRLLKNLKCYGMNSSVNGEMSKQSRVQRRVPQGSVLGPLFLFLVYKRPAWSCQKNLIPLCWWY